MTKENSVVEYWEWQWHCTWPFLRLNQPTAYVFYLHNCVNYFNNLCSIYTISRQWLPQLQTYFLCPDDAIRSPTATTNINNMLTRSIYVFRDDLRYSPKISMPQKVLTSGSACVSPQIDMSIENLVNMHVW